MTTTREKPCFDCMKTTREIRDRLSVELAGCPLKTESSGSTAGISRTRSCAASPTGGGHGNVEAASPLRRARPAALCPTRFRPYPAGK